MDSLSPEDSYHNDLQHQHIKLACQACQRKKIKCDRTFPCGQCQRSKLQCQLSTRKPRARLVGKRATDSELRSRITKLESLVETLSGDVVTPDHPIAEQNEAPTGFAGSPTVGKYMASSFWATLSDEVQALRDALEDDEEPGEEQSPDSLKTAPPNSLDHPDHELIICPPGSIYVMPGALQDPQANTSRQLYDIFLHNADPVFKVLHQPTLQRMLEDGEPYLGQASKSPPNNALRAVMWFAAITTLSDADCVARFKQPRLDLLRLYRRHVDVAFAQADLINTNSLATLQAFVLYTASSRITDLSRRSWTMTALVVRIAQGIGIHREITSDSPYTKEIKRRLWHQIRVLDAFVAVDRASELLISPTSFDTPLPTNCNDADFDESSLSISTRQGLSDMSYNLMAHTATSLTRRLLKSETNPSKEETWQQRLDSALSLGKEIREKYLQYCDLSKPFHRFIYAVGGSMCASSVLRAVRPMQRHVSSVPPRVDSPFVLQLAVNSLRESESTHSDPEADGWRWIFWVQWHALAVALAALCSIRDTELANTAWVYVEKAYERHARHIADTKNGMLWRPIEKLYKKASAFRDGIESPSRNNSLPTQNMPDQLDNMLKDTATVDSLPNKQAHLPAGGMPTSGLVNSPMDMSMLGYDFGDLSTLQGGDFSWMDWENIMSDIQTQPTVDSLNINRMDLINGAELVNGDMLLGEMQQPNAVSSDWRRSVQ